MSTEDKEQSAYSAQVAADQKKDAEALAKAREGSFDAEAETARVREAIINAPAPGSDPDSRQRLAKSLVASGVDLPDGLSTDPVTDEDREAHVAGSADTNSTDEDREGGKLTAAQRRAAAGTSRTATPQNRTATPANKEKASE